MQFDLIDAAIKAGYHSGSETAGGKNASYIPFLRSVPTTLFGLAVVTISGQTFKIGDADYSFAIESISKVFTLALAMDTLGAQVIRQKIGAEPTGLPFNSVVALELHQGKPLSPLVNAGAIATASLVAGDSGDSCWGRILDIQSRFGGLSSSGTENLHKPAVIYHRYRHCAGRAAVGVRLVRQNPAA